MDDSLLKNKWRQVCKAETCQDLARTSGFCPRHYQQIRRRRRLTPERKYDKRGTQCNCENRNDTPTVIGSKHGLDSILRRSYLYKSLIY